MKWLRRLRWLKFSRIAIVVSFALTVMFAGITVYGSQVGSYVIQTNNKSDVRMSVSLSDNILEDAMSRVSVAPPKQGLTNSTLKYLSAKSLMPGVGNKSDNVGGRYIAFSVYLINNSDRVVAYDTQISISGVKADCDEALRVMIIEGEDENAFPGKIMAKPEKSDEDEIELHRQMEQMGYADGEYVTIPFADSKRGLVYSDTTPTFGVGMKVKYTVAIWLEGCDPDCVDELRDRGAGLKMSMTFIGY